MPLVELKDSESHRKAFKVLIRVGGTFHGVPERSLIVTDAQYRALVKAGVVKPDGGKATNGGKKARKRPRA